MVMVIACYFICYNHIIMMVLLLLYTSGISYVAYLNYNYLFVEIVQNLSIQAFVATLLNYFKVRDSKSLFFKQKQIQRMMREQTVILNNLPDGALVYRQLDHNDVVSDGQQFNVIISDQNLTRLKFINQTFKSMFQLFEQKETSNITP